MVDQNHSVYDLRRLAFSNDVHVRKHSNTLKGGSGHLGFPSSLWENKLWFDGEQAFESYLMKSPSNPHILERRLSLLISCQSLALAFPIQIRLVSLRMRWRAGGVIGRGFQSTNWLPQTCWRCWVFERKLSWWCSLLPMQLIGSEKPKKSKISERPTKLCNQWISA